MSMLPGWLQSARATVPQWIRSVKHPSGAGRYRFAVDAYEPYDLDSSCMVENARLTVEGMPPEDERREWVAYLGALQEAENGWLVDPGMERRICSALPDGRLAVPVPEDPRQRELMEAFLRRPGMGHHVLVGRTQASPAEIEQTRGWTSRNGLTTILELGGLPRHKLALARGYTPGERSGGPITGPSGVLRTADEAVEYLSRLDWDNPRGWGAGSWSGAMLWYHRLNQLLGDETAGEVIKAGVGWLLQAQSPETGCWSDLSRVRLAAAVNVIFKLWIQAIPAVGFPVQYPEKVVDLCIRALREDPALVDTPDACSIFDVALVLDTALRFCDHRRDEVAGLAAAALLRIEPLYREDGGFSYGPDGSLVTHGGLHLAPVCLQSDAAGTAIVVNAIALLCSLCGLRDDLGWSPTTESRMGLANKT
jgi:hypothetical protein